MKKKILSLLLLCAVISGSFGVVAVAASSSDDVPEIRKPMSEIVSSWPVESGVRMASAVDDSASVVNNGVAPLMVESIPVDVDSAPLDELGRATLYWSDTKINYDTRMRFISSYTGGYFTLDGVTATFTVDITSGGAENIEIDWCDEDGNVTVLYTGKTSSATVSYTAADREKGNFRVWNKAAAAITVDASISY